jgi:hypothetical protein
LLEGSEEGIYAGQRLTLSPLPTSGHQFDLAQMALMDSINAIYKDELLAYSPQQFARPYSVFSLATPSTALSAIRVTPVSV